MIGREGPEIGEHIVEIQGIEKIVGRARDSEVKGRLRSMTSCSHFTWRQWGQPRNSPRSLCPSRDA